ncbi:hypothetical protein [Aeromonas sp. MrichA-1]|uniref:hypothetical protein n=1 Tax=Aeromonas sp. MrichA-1 TaxID=2823362 RepID=UPI001B33850D|nr:hypothetical protein [Aeromonas sp. MrichA-1]MBP4081691.1 hypothetical protein [Aeromonas sp. MrichA-1]
MMINVVLNPVLTKVSVTGRNKKGLSFSFCTNEDVNLGDLVEIKVNNKVFSFEVCEMEISGSHLLCYCREYGYFAEFLSYHYSKMGVSLFDIQHQDVSFIREKDKIKQLNEASSWT